MVKELAQTHPELLEISSIDGWTPLLVAACHGKVEAMQTLLESGANPFSTDPLGRNMLHLLLASPGTGRLQSDPNALPSFLRWMDTTILQSLLEQQCIESPGGQTPLSRWILTRPEPGILFNAVLELSSIRVFEIFDGVGRTPLHTVRASPCAC